MNHDDNFIGAILYSIGFFGVFILAGLWLVKNAMTKKRGDK